ncbi:two component transcriptional regulator, LytTR family [Desulfofarcimen acetoxidans DSM 771]|uniref:Stage 0 sporulation protein A homolog n=1 Tax=Desulfofarcimen acetoxidans (strain ATCC 49208 / DSM 771 / KCTC 5769 / VKM B-1644 / 5575) TaxID=485916 RepID=C8W4Z0_DESAS|nr:LytTR family DNA-binding domain-containing protein [Desulfofarcimen acetoxidans]ACV61342.1 two component transcriptional regulator, LytTR family [Desulfofarcimen acetoxidans DSM 771]
MLEARVLIVEDNEDVREHIKTIINTQADFTVVGECGNGNEVLDLVEKYHPNIVLLDIEIPSRTGIDVAKDLAELKPGIFLIFITGHSEFCLTAFEIKSLDYILKPFTEERVISSLLRAKSFLNCLNPAFVNMSRISIKTRGGTIIFIEAKSISYIEKVKGIKYISIYTDHGYYNITETLNDIEAKLPEQFYRCHKSFIINLERVKALVRDGLNTFHVLLNNSKQKVSVSKYHYDELIKKLNS